MDKKHWQKEYATIPRWHCPRCDDGRLMLRGEGLNYHEPAWATIELDTYDLRGERSIGRFAGFLYCDADGCHDVVAVSGDYTADFDQYVDDILDSVSVRTTRKHTVRCASPMPKIIDLPSSLSDDCRFHVRAAEGLYFVDLGACANKLRVAVECLLTDLGIPLDKQNAKGKTMPLNLASRIDALEAAVPGHKSILDALRLVGNVGSHKGEADFEHVTNCFMLMEHALAELVGNRTGTMDQVALAIVAKKGH